MNKDSLNHLVSLKSSKEFNLANKYGIKKYGKYCLIIQTKNFNEITTDNPNICFFGMKVSKKLSKKAVIRNKIKRRIRHIMRDIAKNPNIDLSCQALIIIPKKDFYNIEFQKIKNDFEMLLSNNISQSK